MVYGSVGALSYSPESGPRPSAPDRKIAPGPAAMSRQDANAAFARTSFLYGGNAGYIEDLYARYRADARAVDGEWAAFFRGLAEEPTDGAGRAPSWQRPHWPQLPTSELVSALDGDWHEAEKAVADKVRARAQATGVELSAAQVQQATRD